MSNTQTEGKKPRSTVDKIMINTIIEKQRWSHKNTYLFFADTKMLWQIMAEGLPNRHGRDRLQ